MSGKPVNPEEIIFLHKEYLKYTHPLFILESSKDPYVIGTAVILSANTTDNAVNKVIDNLIHIYPTPESIVKTTRDDIVPLLPGIAHSGNKSDYIRNWAQYIITLKSQKKNISNDIKELTAIKGIGRKTAAIIIFRVHNIETGFPLDTHCLRILDRLKWYPSSNPKTLEKQILKDFTKPHAAHIILTHHGRNVCKPKNPICSECHYSEYCSYFNV